MNDLFDEAECTRPTKGGDGSSDTRTSAWACAGQRHV